MKKETKKRILIIEDELSLQHAIVHKLEKEGFDTMTAISGEEALLILKKNSLGSDATNVGHANNKVDMIWLDLLIPGMGGLKFLESIKQNEKYNNIPIIVVSVSAGTETLKEVSGHKVLEYFIKSQSDLSHIVEKVKNHLIKS